MFPVGHVLGETYRIERLLGKGGMACVYVVSHVRLPRRFALKVITAPAAQGSEYVLRFRREAEILAELEHPNLVTVNDWNVTPDGKPYLVMELLNGEDLAQCLSRTGALPQCVALSIFAQVCEALQVAHARNIVHRDLKPANIFLCKNGMNLYFAKVLDFGIAKSAQHAGGAVTEQLVLMGTPAYMAPEQAQGNVAVIDARTDQFAMALVLYEMLTGRSAFYRRGEAPMLTIYRVITEDPEPLADAQLNRAVMRALRKNPDERYPSLSEFVSAVLSCTPEPIELPEKTDRIASEPAIAPEHRAKPSGAAPLVAPEMFDPELDVTAPVPLQSGAELRGPLLSEAPLPKAVCSSITQPGVELVPHRRLRRSLRQRLLIAGISSSTLLVVGLFLLSGVAQRVPRRPLTVASESSGPTEEPADTASRPPHSPAASLASQPETPAPAARPPAAEPPQAPLERPIPLPPSGKQPVRPRPIRRSLPSHVQPMLSGVEPESPAGKQILSCIQTVFGPNPRRANGLLIRLYRTDQLKVGSPLPPERSLQLEECLSGLAAPDTPSQAVISFQAR